MKPTNYNIYKKQQLKKVASLKIVRKRMHWFAIAIIVLAIGVAATVAFAVTPANGGMVGGSTIVVDNTGGDQLDPHVSGDIAAYTDFGDLSLPPAIRYYDFLNPTSPNPAITAGFGDQDTLSDVNGNHIAFNRYNSVSGSGACMVFDVVTHSTIQIASGIPVGQTALGGDTVAFVSDGDIMVGHISTPGGPLVNLSTSTDFDLSPAVAPTGNAVVWTSCISSPLSSCKVMKSIFSGGSWGTAQVVSNTGGRDTLPDTDGVYIVYQSNRPGSLGGDDIFFQPLNGGVETQMSIDGVQRNPSIAGGVITFESSVDGIAASDLFVYQIATNTLFRVTDTLVTNETLNDVTVLPNGDVRVVWAADDEVGGLHNIYARTFTLPQSLPLPQPSSFQVCLLYDPLVARKSGTTYPIKLQLCDSNGQNLSAPSIAVHAVSVTQASTNAPGPLDDTGNANPDFDFRYDATLGGTGGYIFNLCLRGAPTGTYNLNFRAGTDPALHSARFAVK
jgi:hypothetical protein